MDSKSTSLTYNQHILVSEDFSLPKCSSCGHLTWKLIQAWYIRNYRSPKENKKLIGFRLPECSETFTTAKKDQKCIKMQFEYM